MRTLKFRAWHRRQMYDVNTIGIDQDGINKDMCFAHVDSQSGNGKFKRDDDGCILFDDKTEIMQFTGLLDKNGVEIYESDIVSPKNNSGNWIGVVQWNRGAFWIYEVAGELSREESQWSIDIDCEIIGNIHQNPELI